jgi:hypothetical protein
MTMTMADVLTWTLGIVGSLAVLVSYWLAAQGLFPGLVRRASACYQRPVRVTLAGLAVAAPAILLGGFVYQARSPALKFVGAFLIALPALIGLMGSSGLCHRIGTGLASPMDEKQPWRRVLRGGIVLALTFVLPAVGWFVLLPWALISGFGAALLSVRSGTSPEPPVASEPALPSPRGATG